MFDKGFGYDVLATCGRIAGSNSAIRKTFLPCILPFPSPIYPHDEMIALTALMYGKIARIDKCLSEYRLHGDQTSGVMVLLKYPPLRWELANGIRIWHEELFKGINDNFCAKIKFDHKRFIALREKRSFIRYAGMLLRGEYHKYYDNPYMLFLRDLKNIFVRLFRVK